MAIHATYKTYTTKWLPEVTDCNDKNAEGYAGVFGKALDCIQMKMEKVK